MKTSESSDSEGVADHRIPITIIASLIATCFILGSVALVFQKDTFIAKRKAFQYMVLSTVGLLFYLRDTIEIAWTYPDYNSNPRVTYMYYLIAVPLHYIPVIVRSWRIYCVYRSTPTWKCQMEPITSRRRRGHAWMLKRIIILYIPFIPICFGLVFNQASVIPYYTYIGLNGVYAIGNFSLTILLYNIRMELRQKYLDETSCLISYSVASLVEWIFANTLYILGLFNSVYGIIVYYMYIELALIWIMWFLTTGRICYRVWIRRDLMGDKKPELGDHEIQKAMQRVNTQVSSIEMTSASDIDMESDVGKGDSQ